MIRTVRDTLRQLGGAQVLLAVAAIGWGLGTLQRIAEERQARLEHLAEQLAEAEERAAARLAQEVDDLLAGPVPDDLVRDVAGGPDIELCDMPRCIRNRNHDGDHDLLPVGGAR